MDVPVVEALEGLFAGKEDVGQRQVDVHRALALSDALRLELAHLLWVGWNHHLPRERRDEFGVGS